MAHNINFENGSYSFFSANVPAWHQLGKVVSGSQTWEEAIKLANMDYEVVKSQLVHPRTGEALEGAYGIFRSDNDVFLGSVGERYTPIQNHFMFSFMDSVLDADGKAHYETAGVLGKGERVFMLANLTDEYDIHGTGDKHKAYFAGVGSHDGSTSTRFFVTEVRIVCANTVQIALNKAKGQGVSVRHTVNAEARLDERLRDLQNARFAFNDTMKKLEFLAEKKIDIASVDTILSEIFNLSNGLEEASTRAKNSVELVKSLLESNDNDAFPEFRGTAYNLFNAVTEYQDHYSEVRTTSGRVGIEKTQLRAESAMFGRGADFKANALDIIMTQANNLQSISQHKSYSLANQSSSSVLDDILNKS